MTSHNSFMPQAEVKSQVTQQARLHLAGTPPRGDVQLVVWCGTRVGRILRHHQERKGQGLMNARTLMADQSPQRIYPLGRMMQLYGKPAADRARARSVVKSN